MLLLLIEPETVTSEKPSKAVETPKTAESTSKVRATPDKDKESNFVLEPVNVTPTVVERGKRKRRVVMDNDKEFSGQQIKSQFEDYNDLLQPKCFPPPTKKAMMWREMAGCEQLYSNPTFPGLTKSLQTIIKGNYSTSLEFADFALDRSILDEITTAEPTVDATEPPSVNTEEQNTSMPLLEPTTDPVEPPPVEAEEQNTTMPDLEPIADPVEPPPVDNEEQSTAIPEMEPVGDPMEPLQGDEENMDSAADRLSNELPEEFEQRRWTKHTQQVVRLLDRNFKKSETVTFSSLTVKCDRKSAASQFYTCLLLAKEGIIDVEQLEPYAEISIQKGLKYVGTV